MGTEANINGRKMNYDKGQNSHLLNQESGGVYRNPTQSLHTHRHAVSSHGHLYGPTGLEYRDQVELLTLVGISWDSQSIWIDGYLPDLSSLSFPVLVPL